MSCLDNLTNQVQSHLFQQTADRNSCSKGQQQGSGGIPLATKVCYAVGEVPYQLTTAAIRVSLQIFLLDVVQLEASYVSLILFISRAWDAVTDPVVGYLVSCSNWTPIGKLTPWMFLSTPFGILFYLLLWSVPRASLSQGLRVTWFLSASCLFETLMSLQAVSPWLLSFTLLMCCQLVSCFPLSSIKQCYNVPYLTLNMFLGGDHRDRDSAMAYRMTVKMVSMLVASAVQGQVVTVYNIEKQEVCQHLDQANETIPQSTSSPQTAQLQETENAFLTSALIMSAVLFICSLVVVLGVKEQRAPSCSEDKVRPAFMTSMKMLICHIPYQRLVLGFVFCALAFQMSLGNFALFCSHAAGLGAQFQYILLVLLVSATIAVPLWQMLLLRIGKKATVFIGLSLFIPAVVVVACVPSNLPVLMIMCVLMGFSLATIYLLPWSMLPDVVDDFAVRHPSCKDLEPMFFSCYAFCNKLTGGLSIGISTLTLQFVGYKAGACNHGDGVVTALIVLFSPVPIALLLISMVCFCTYPIDERRCLQLQEQPTIVHPEASSSPSSSSSSSSDPKENAEPPSVLQQPNADAASTTHYNTKTSTLYKSQSLPGCYNHYKKCSFKLSDCSNVPKRPSREYRRPKPVVHKQRLSSHRCLGDNELGRNVPENDPELFSSRSNKRSKMSWV